MKTSDPQAAIDEFLGIPALEEEKGDWGFKGLKQAIKLEFKLGLYDKVRLPFFFLHKPNISRLPNTMLNFSPMSRAPSPATTPKSPSITSSTTSRKPLAMRVRQSVWNS